MGSPVASANELSDAIALGVRHLNRGEVEEAEALLSQIIAIDPNLPQALMLMGVVRLEQARHAEAETLLSKASDFSPHQPRVLFYLGNARRSLGNLHAALALYREAFQLQPAFLEAGMGLAETLQCLSRFTEAEAVYRGILRQAPQMPDALAGLGATLNNLDRHDEAERLLSTAQKIQADRSTAALVENGLADAKRMQRRFAEALPHAERAIAIVPELVSAYRNRATILEQLKQPERAVAAYRRVLALDPLDLKTHLLLNELLNRTGRPMEILRSYDDACRAFPSNAVLPTAKADQLMLLNRPEEAATNYRRALVLEPGHLGAQIGLARARSAIGDKSGAVATFEQGYAMHPDNPHLLTAFAFCLLEQDDAKRALSHADRAVALAPHSQPALSVLGLCYRANNDSREEWLNGYDTFIRVFDLEVPDGYDDMGAFNRALNSHLDATHAEGAQFFSQTLRGGTRGSEEILSYRHPLRDSLRERISGAVGQYVSELNEDPKHPFAGRRAQAFRYSGSWSSRSQAGGYHINHIHEGWISSAYYVDVPDVVGDSEKKQGWLKFGEPPADMDFSAPARRVVQPRPGRLVLFPSYMWHGTIPFYSGQSRTTIAFDIVPL